MLTLYDDVFSPYARKVRIARRLDVQRSGMRRVDAHAVAVGSPQAGAIPAARQFRLHVGGRLDVSGKHVSVCKAELAGNQFQTVGVRDVDMAFGERLAQRLRHELGLEKGMHGLILNRQA